MKAKGAGAVMASRKESRDSLDFFPTPPWATRALFHHVLSAPELGESVWEPAAGEGHMAEVLKEFFPVVLASDVEDYGKGYRVGSFVGQGLDVVPSMLFSDWIITNPPFRLAEEFVERALKEARRGVAMLLRTSWLESDGRYREIFTVHPPAIIAIFAERVPMEKGRWNPDGSSATSYSWFVWRVPRTAANITEFRWIPPGQRRALTLPDDVRRFAKPKEQTDGLFTAAAEH